MPVFPHTSGSLYSSICQRYPNIFMSLDVEFGVLSRGEVRIGLTPTVPAVHIDLYPEIALFGQFCTEMIAIATSMRHNSTTTHFQKLLLRYSESARDSTSR